MLRAALHLWETVMNAGPLDKLAAANMMVAEPGSWLPPKSRRSPECVLQGSISTRAQSLLDDTERVLHLAQRELAEAEKSVERCSPPPPPFFFFNHSCSV